VTCAHCRPIWTVYVQIVFTLREVLKKKKPEPDTLGLRSCQRLSLCFQLLDDSIPSWKNLAEYIGNETITIIISRTSGSTGSDHLVMQTVKLSTAGDSASPDICFIILFSLCSDTSVYRAYLKIVLSIYFMPF